MKRFINYFLLINLILINHFNLKYEHIIKRFDYFRAILNNKVGIGKFVIIYNV